MTLKKHLQALAITAENKLLKPREIKRLSLTIDQQDNEAVGEILDRAKKANRPLYTSTSNRGFTFDKIQNMTPEEYRNLTEGERLNFADILANDVADELKTGEVVVVYQQTRPKRQSYAGIVAKTVLQHALITGPTLLAENLPLTLGTFAAVSAAQVAKVLYDKQKVKHKIATEQISDGTYFPGFNVIAVERSLSLNRTKQVIPHEVRHHYQTRALYNDLPACVMPPETEIESFHPKNNRRSLPHPDRPIEKDAHAYTDDYNSRKFTPEKTT